MSWAAHYALIFKEVFANMKLYVDSADLNELECLKNSPFVDGITTNPSLIANGMGKSNPADSEYFDYLQKIRRMAPGELFIQIASSERDSVVYEISKIRELIRWPVVIKVPAVPDGYYAISRLAKEGMSSALTAVYSPGQACLGIAAGAKYIIPYYSRLEGEKEGSGLELCRSLLKIAGPEKLLVASVKTEEDVALLLNEGVINFTLPYTLFSKMGTHPMTDKAVSGFSDSLRVEWSRKKNR